MKYNDYNNEELNNNIIEFINNKKLQDKLSDLEIYKYFIQLIHNFSLKLNNKFLNIENKNEIIFNGINIIVNLYFILIFHSNNIKLTIFLIERAMLLYNEFIIMSNDNSIINDICFTPNINDEFYLFIKKQLVI